MGAASDLTCSPCLKRILALATHPGLLTQQLNVFDQSWWSKTLLVNTYLRKTAMVVEMVWSNIYNCWVSRLGFAAQARTLFRKGEYVKSDAVPMRRLS